MSTVQSQRREESGPRHERASPARSRQSNAHPYTLLMSSASNEGAHTSSSTTSAANLAALVPPSMRTRTSAGATERRYSDSSGSSTSSRWRRNNHTLLPLAGRSSADSENGTGYRSLSPPRASPSKLSPLRERRRYHRKSPSLSEVSVSTADEEAMEVTPPPPPVVTAAASPAASASRTVSASDYVPLPEQAEWVKEGDATGQTPSPPPKLARPRFGRASTVIPVAPTTFAAVDTSDSAALAAITPHSSSSVATPPTSGTTIILDAPAEPKTPDPPKAPPLPSPPLPSPPLRYGVPASSHGVAAMPPMTSPPPIAPRPVHSASASDADTRAGDMGFTPVSHIPTETPQRRHDRQPSSRTATPKQTHGATNNTRTRSSRRPTQSVQTAHARAQQRRTAASSSPHSRGTPVTQQPDFFPGAKRLDDDRVPLSTKLVLGTACVVGVALVFYFGRSIYRYASVNIMDPGPPVPTSKFARARTPKTAVVTDKEAAKIVREIRDRIVGNMQNSICKEDLPVLAVKES